MDSMNSDRRWNEECMVRLNQKFENEFGVENLKVTCRKKNKKI